ncbi:hypothetical protein EJK54_0646 [Moraxella catarrhalis]|uniref:MFS transporter n=1 Tax=Moraxella catarrhalis TaxID=480 RepID=A0ABY0BL29_MORCA|nr:hypothetical protein EJK54_0646 [Moraxella catarrhalis]
MHKEYESESQPNLTNTDKFLLFYTILSVWCDYFIGFMDEILI